MKTDKLTYQESTFALCYLISDLDGVINHFESRMLDFIKYNENIAEDISDKIIELCKVAPKEEILLNAITNLVQCDLTFQLKSLAWINTIANADGTLDDEEWSIFYRLYKTELKIDLKDILAVELPLMDYNFYMYQN